MTKEELYEKLEEIQKIRCETQTLELKKAEQGCPKRLYDTLSSFSNQDEGGTIVFGVDEENDYEETGVYDPQDIQKKINEQCKQMEPAIRPLITVVEKNNKHFVSAEIPGLDLIVRPCYYKGSGRLKGSYVRIGDSDEHMTEYEVYSYEAYRKKYQDDVRIIPRVTWETLSEKLINEYTVALKRGKPRLTIMEDQDIYELMSIKKGSEIPLSSTLMFCPFPQAFLPQLCIIATVIPGTEQGLVGTDGARFLDNQRIEGNISEMLDGAMQFVKRNMRTKTIINSKTGKREDKTDYPIPAIRETLINALVHRDYSIHTEGMPIQLIMYEDRIEIHNPSGIYGKIRVDQLGKIQPDTRNPVLASELEVLNLTENRYSGIPTICREMRENGMRPPVFLDERGSFIVKLFKGENRKAIGLQEQEILEYCKEPRTRKELCDFLGLTSVTYAISKKITPLVERGLIELSIPDKPSSTKQTYTTKN